MLRVQDIMTRDVVRLTPETTIREAMETLSTKHLSGAPVVAGDRVLGVLAMSDLLAFLISSPEADGAEQEETFAEVIEGSEDDSEEDEIVASFPGDLWADAFDQHTVDEAMNREVISVAPTASVRTAARVMRDRGIHRVLVMEGKAIVGIVSSLDIARIVSDKVSDGGIKVRVHNPVTAAWT